MHWIDPDCLQETRGIVTQFLMNPHGELDGFLLGEAEDHWKYSQASTVSSGSIEMQRILLSPAMLAAK